MSFVRSKILWMVLTLALVVVLVEVGRAQYRKHQEVQGNLRAQLDTYGDGRFKMELSKMTPEDIEKMLWKIGLERSQTFVELVTDGKYYSGTGIFPGSLDLHAAESARIALSKIPDVPSDEVWEGLKEINSLVPGIHSLNNEIEENGTFLNTARGDEMDQFVKARAECSKEIKGLQDRMREIAALTLDRVPGPQRKKVLKALETALEE